MADTNTAAGASATTGTEGIASTTNTAGAAATPRNAGAAGGLDLSRFQQEVADEIGLGADILSRLSPRSQPVSDLEQKSHSR